MDFLTGSEDREIQKRSRLKKWLLWVVIGVFVIYAVLVVYGLGRFVAAGMNIQERLETINVAFDAFDIDTIETELDGIQTDLEQAKSGLVFFAPIKIVPIIGDQVEAVEVSVNATIEAIPAIKETLSLGALVYSVIEQTEAVTDYTFDPNQTFFDFPKELRVQILRRLHQSLPEIELIRTHLDLAAGELEDLDSLTIIQPLRQFLEPVSELIPQLQEAVEFILPFAAILPDVAGFEEPKQFLVLFLNNAELRPGGGFIGVYATLYVDGGEIIGFATEDTVVLDESVRDLVEELPPQAFVDYLGVDKWFFRDSAWSPDFSVTAEKSLELLRSEQALAGRSVIDYDGVIALTPTFASDLLDIVGEIAISDEVYTSENLRNLLQYQVLYEFEQEGIPRSERKDIVGELSSVVLERLFSLPLSDWLDVIELTRMHADEKQVFMYSENIESQSVLEGKNWSGIVPKTDGDILLFADANMASLKSDPSVDRSIEYTVEENESREYIATARIDYIHNGTFDWRTTRYRTYVRVYVPLGSELISSSGSLVNDILSNPGLLPGDVVVGEELGYSTFGAFTSIEPGNEGFLEFTYKLPVSIVEMIENGTYTLNVVKQPGAANYPLTLRLDFDKPLASASPSEDSRDFGDDIYSLNTILSQDQMFTIRF